MKKETTLSKVLRYIGDIFYKIFMKVESCLSGLGSVPRGMEFPQKAFMLPVQRLKL
jgi:hypothetical protein